MLAVCALNGNPPFAPAALAYQLRSSVVGAAGSPGASAGHQSRGTAGQPTPIGIGIASGKVLYAGFWPEHWVYADVPGLEGTDVFVNALFQNSPNPFGHQTTIAFTIARESVVEVEVFDVRGRKVRSLVDEVRAPGRHQTMWDSKDDRGSSVSPGVYFYQMKVGSYRSVKKMVAIR
jgi:hypothetical protein